MDMRGCLQCMAAAGNLPSDVSSVKVLAHSTVQRLVSNAAGFRACPFFSPFFLPPTALLGFISWRPLTLGGLAGRSTTQKRTVCSFCSEHSWHLVPQDFRLFKRNTHQQADGWEALFWSLVSHLLWDWCYFFFITKSGKG